MPDDFEDWRDCDRTAADSAFRLLKERAGLVQRDMRGANFGLVDRQNYVIGFGRSAKTSTCARRRMIEYCTFCCNITLINKVVRDLNVYFLILYANKPTLVIVSELTTKTYSSP